jgi:uncharacterized protein YjbI with pentapeptide repeats
MAPMTRGQLLLRYLAAGKSVFQLDFRQADLENADLEEAYLNQVDLQDSMMRKANLNGCVLQNANLQSVDLTDAQLVGAQASGLHLSGANLANAGMFQANFSDSQLRRVNLAGASLTGATMRATNLEGSNLASALLQGANLQGSNLSNADLTDANLQDADLSNTQLRASSLRGADLKSARLSWADLTRADLRGARVNLLQGLVEVRDAQVDAATYRASGWSPSILTQLIERGIYIAEPDMFPTPARHVIFGDQHGLFLEFRSPLNRESRFLLDGLIIATLGPETDCDFADFKQIGSGSRIRLTASDINDLHRIANVLVSRVWESQQEHTAEGALGVKIRRLLADESHSRRLSSMIDQALRFELWVNDESGELTHIKDWQPVRNPREALKDLLLLLLPRFNDMSTFVRECMGELVALPADDPSSAADLAITVFEKREIAYTEVLNQLGERFAEYVPQIEGVRYLWESQQG